MKLTPQQFRLALEYMYEEVQDLTVKELIDKMGDIPDTIDLMECENHIELSHVISVNLSPYIKII